MTQQELESLCAKWQRRLRLQDWNVTVELVRHFDIPDRVDEASMQIERKEATIKIVSPADRHEQDNPFEHTLIHELLHLHFEPFWNNEKGVEMEQAINLIAGALCE